MNTVAVTRKEGSEWIPFKDPSSRWAGVNGEVHSIKFDNGCEWDKVNGWRKGVRIRVKMGRELV